MRKSSKPNNQNHTPKRTSGRKKIKPWLRNTWIVSFKAKRKPPHTQPKKRTSAILEHLELFKLLLFFTMTVWAVLILESSLCLQPVQKKFVSSNPVLLFSPPDSTSVCLSLSLLFSKFELPNQESVSVVKTIRD